VTLENLRFLIYEVGRRLELKEVYIIGSAAIAATVPNPPEGELTATRDVDVIPPGDAESLMDQIDLFLGEGSAFDEQRGYYAQGVSSKTPAYAPRNWQSRTIPVQTQTAVGRCMELNDLAVSKLGAGRDKDLAFVKQLADLGHINRETLLERLTSVECSEEMRALIAARIAAATAAQN
jgi:hypothetical protein